MIDATERALAAGITAARPGQLLAIEPWVMADTAELKMDDDGWMLRSVTGCRTADSEPTIAITPRGAEILTRPGSSDRRISSVMPAR